MDYSNKESEFNEAADKMRRIAWLQDEINRLRTNQLAWNYEYQMYNYQIIESHIRSMCSETIGLLTKDERKQLLEWRTKLDDFNESYHIHGVVTMANISGKKTSNIINLMAWKELRKMLYEFEDFARISIDAHGLSGNKKKNPSKAISLT